jgi:hypothetical protein
MPGVHVWSVGKLDRSEHAANTSSKSGASRGHRESIDVEELVLENKQIKNKEAVRKQTEMRADTSRKVKIVTKVTSAWPKEKDEDDNYITMLVETSGEKAVFTAGNALPKEPVVMRPADHFSEDLCVKLNGKPIWESKCFRDQNVAFWSVTGENIYSDMTVETYPAFRGSMVAEIPSLPGVGLLALSGDKQENILQFWSCMGWGWCYKRKGIKIRGRGIHLNQPGLDRSFEMAVNSMPDLSGVAKMAEVTDFASLVMMAPQKDEETMKWLIRGMGCVDQMEWSKAVRIFREMFDRSSFVSTEEWCLELVRLSCHSKEPGPFERGVRDWMDHKVSEESAKIGEWLWTMDSLPKTWRTSNAVLSNSLRLKGGRDESKEIMKESGFTDAWRYFSDSWANLNQTGILSETETESET